MNTQKVLWGILIAGAIWVTVSAVLPVIVAVAEMRHTPQPIYGQQNWFSLEGFYALLQVLLGFVMAGAVLALPIGVWSQIARRQMISKRLSAEPIQHGKYLPWGRNLRRHPSIPARYSGLRPRKRLRPLRRLAQ